MSERRRARRRRLPYLRSAVLEVDGRGHIVVLQDLSPEGAFLASRAALDPDQRLALRVVLPRDGREVRLPCRLVWRSERFDATTGRPAGLAVAFMDLGASVLSRLAEIAAEGFLPALEPRPSAHYEYRLLERLDVEVDELNHLGLDGWQLASAVSSPSGIRLILYRRL